MLPNNSASQKNSWFIRVFSIKCVKWTIKILVSSPTLIIPLIIFGPFKLMQTLIQDAVYSRGRVKKYICIQILIDVINTMTKYNPLLVAGLSLFYLLG